MLLHATRKTIDESGDSLTDEEKSSVEGTLTSLEEAVKSEDLEKIESATKDLNDVLTPLSEKLYKQSEDSSESPSAEDAPHENTVDAEFEEVKEEEQK